METNDTLQTFKKKTLKWLEDNTLKWLVYLVISYFLWMVLFFIWSAFIGGSAWRKDYQSGNKRYYIEENEGN